MRVGAAERLPFADGSFDVVVAKHMLYHTDVRRALREAKRVLRQGGILLATTNAMGLWPLNRRCDRLAARLLKRPAPRVLAEFNLANGRRKIRSVFGNCSRPRLVRYTMVFREPDGLLEHFASRRGFWKPLPREREWQRVLAATRALLEREIARNGALREPHCSGALSARKADHGRRLARRGRGRGSCP